jgi:uncharacterized membrane protein
MTTMDRPAAKLDIGRVVRDTFGVIRAKPVTLVALAVLSGLVSALNSYVNISRVRGGGAVSLFWGGPLIMFVLVSLTAGFVLSAQMYVTVRELEGASTSTSDVVRHGLRRMLPTIAILLIWSIAVGLASILLFVPGAILATLWFVALPAGIMEPGPMRAFGRSRALTKGNRWRLFGLSLIILIVLLLLEGILFGAVGGIRGYFTAMQSGGVLIIGLIGIIGVIFGVLLNVGLGATYVQLRELKGGGSEGVARVFE